MGFTRGFIEFERIEQPHVSVEERVKSFCEIYGTLTDEQAKIQAGRCMDCGIPFCLITLCCKIFAQQHSQILIVFTKKNLQTVFHNLFFLYVNTLFFNILILNNR